MQWSTNPAIQSGIIEHVEGDTSQVMSWNMSSLNAGIGVGGIVGGLVMTHLSVEYVTYTSSALIGLISLIIVFTLKIDTMLKIMTGKVCTIAHRSIFMILVLCMLSVPFQSLLLDM